MGGVANMATFVLLRADDLLVVGVRWFGFTNTGTVDAAGAAILTAGANARLVVVLPPQHIAEEASLPDTEAPLQIPAGSAGDPVPTWRGALSAPSRLAFAFAAGTRVSLSTEGILAAIADHPILLPDGPPSGGDTAIELPWRVVIEPRTRSTAGTVVCRHQTRPEPGDTVELWRTILADASTSPRESVLDAGLALRVTDNATASSTDPTFPIPLSLNERMQLVIETNQQPAAATRLELSCLGGTLDASGIWQDYEWEHHTVLGRDMYVRTLAKGAMYPFGHHAEYVEVSERVFDPSAGGAAVLRSFNTLSITEPVRHPPEEGPIRRAFPLGDVEITTTRFTKLDKPTWQTMSLPGLGDVSTHFWPFTPEKHPVLFPIQCTTPTGVVKFDAPLIFVKDFNSAFSTMPSPGVAFRLAADYDTTHVRIAPTNLDLVGAARKENGDVHEVHALTIAGVGKGTALEDGYRAKLTEFEVALPALRTLRGEDTRPTVKFAEKYLQNGAEDVILQMTAPIEIDFTNAADRSGGLVAPKYTSNAVSRTLGPIDLQSLPDPTTGFINPASLFRNNEANLLGFPLRSLLAQLKLPPEITATPTAGSAPATRMQWRDVKLTSLGPFQSKSTTRLELSITTEPGHNRTDCSINDFALELPPGPRKVLRLTFASMKFTQSDGNSPSLQIAGVRAEFLGDLKLLEALQNVIDLDTAAKLLDVRPSGLAVRYSLPLPPISAGAFVMRNMALTAGIEVPFDGRPVAVSLGFASRANPFQLGVMMFGGGGYLELQLDRDGLKRFEASLEFGAFVAVNFVVAAGEVHALGGVRFVLNEGSVTVTGYLRIGGCLEVLGLVSVAIELCLSLTYHPEKNALVGRATMIIEIDLTLWSDKVELDSGEWALAGGRGRRRPAIDQKYRSEDEGLKRWRDYRTAFASEDVPRPNLDASNAGRRRPGKGTSMIELRTIFEASIPEGVAHLTWSKDECSIIATGQNVADLGAITVLDAESGAIRWRSPTIAYLQKSFIVISPDSKRIAYSTKAGHLVEGIWQGIERLQMLDAATGTEIWDTPIYSPFASFSPDGRMLTVTSGDPHDRVRPLQVLVLDAHNGMRLHEYGRSGAAATFSADCRLLCTGSPALYNNETGQTVWKIEDHGTSASASTFTSQNDGVICASARDGTITVYELEPDADGAPRVRSRVEAPGLTTAATDYDISTYSYSDGPIRFSPDKSCIAFVGEHKLHVNSTADGHPKLLYPHDDHYRPNGWAFRPGKSQIAATSQADTWGLTVGCDIVDTTTGSRVWTGFVKDLMSSEAIAFSDNGSRVAIGMQSNRVGELARGSVTVAEIGKAANFRRDCCARVTAVAVSNAEAGIVAAITDGTGSESMLNVIRAGTADLVLKKGISAATIAASPDGRSVVVGSTTGRCVLFDTETGQRWIGKHGDRVDAVAFSDDSAHVVTASKDRNARMYERRLTPGSDPDDHQPLWSTLHPNAVTHLAVGPNLTWIATACLDRNLRILSGASGEPLYSPYMHESRICALSVSRTGILASLGNDGIVQLIDGETGRQKRRIELRWSVNVAVINADGSLLAVPGTDNVVEIWRVDAPAASPPRSIQANGPVEDLMFDPSGSTLAVVAANHRSVQLFDPDTGVEEDRLFHTQPVRHITIGPDGGLLVSASVDNFVSVFEVGHDE
ncbi:PQQ-binding-like beta-propeller repeat protein [Rhodococcus sp. NPDC059968]|uniref:outer membrane protein assembly factor BamB family protein n=1 Tax=Rhodococcus sp. NPDC059968 TaxID=3347017 RepID=UPI00366E5751